MKRVKNKRNLVISAFLGLSIVIFSTWGAVAPLLVYALPPALLKARTIAELIITIFAGAGTAITNPIVLTAIESPYAGNNYTFESLIENDILVPADPSMTKAEAIAALGTQTSLSPRFLNLDAQGFRALMESNWQSMIDYRVDAALRLNNIANKDSVYGAIDNLGQLVLDVANMGYLGVENEIAIIANPGASVKVGFEAILDSIKQVFGLNMDKGAPTNVTVDSTINCEYINTLRYYTTYSPTGYKTVIYYVPEGVYAYGVQGSTLQKYCTIDRNSRYGKRQEINSRGVYQTPENQKYSENVYPSIGSESEDYVSSSYPKTWQGPMVASSSSEAEELLRQIKEDGFIPVIQSPDVINQNQGNVTDVTDVAPAVTEGYGIEPISLTDYNDFLGNTETPGAQNAEEMQELLTPYINEIPEATEPWENPDIPGTNPIVPDQPDMPDQPSFTDSEIENALVPNAEGLAAVFPFCIPWDIYAFVKGFEIDREAPVIVWRFQSEHFDIDHTFVIDLSGFDDVANILRKLELILFIIGLAIETRKIIGA